MLDIHRSLGMHLRPHFITNESPSYTQVYRHCRAWMSLGSAVVHFMYCFAPSGNWVNSGPCNTCWYYIIRCCLAWCGMGKFVGHRDGDFTLFWLRLRDLHWTSNERNFMWKVTNRGWLIAIIFSLSAHVFFAFHFQGSSCDFVYENT